MAERRSGNRINSRDVSRSQCAISPGTSVEPISNSPVRICRMPGRINKGVQRERGRSNARGVHVLERQRIYFGRGAVYPRRLTRRSVQKLIAEILRLAAVVCVRRLPARRRAGRTRMRARRGAVEDTQIS